MVVIGPTISGVVLLVPQHLHFFCDELIPNLGALTTPFDELLVIASGLSPRQIRQVERTLSSLVNHPRKRVVKVQLGSVGANRNHGLNHATSDFVTFLDSDDLYSPDYCAFLKSAHEVQPYQVLLHSYLSIPGDHSGPLEFDSLETMLGAPFSRNEAFNSETLDFWGPDPSRLKSSSLSFIDDKNKGDIHQGHMTLSRLLPLRFHEKPMFRNEDGIFLQQCLSLAYVVHYYPVKLSAYRLGSSANPIRYRLFRLAGRMWEKFTFSSKSV